MEQQIETTSNSISKFDSYSNKGLTGLANLGNTCFMNSTIQCLSHTYEFNNFMNSKTYKKYLTNTPESNMLEEWDKLRELMWSENCTISPGGFLTNVHKLAKAKDKEIFTGYAQNDLPEFLLFIIDSFHEGIKRPVIMNINGTPENDKDKLAIKCYKMISKMYKNDYSEIIKLFYGIHVSQILDTSGKVLSINAEPFFMINLPIKTNVKTTTIYESFDIYTEREQMNGDNQWYNDKLKEKQDVEKFISFFSLPDILVIDFKRFNYEMKKNNILIDFPLENLNLSKYVIGYDTHSYIYDLYGVCNHSGSTMGGHYTAYVKNANGKWYHFNDTQVSEIKQSNIVSNKAYCLFYRKKYN
jgi:ubiquitin carboxyl-terminal hydrolase 2